MNWNVDIILQFKVESIQVEHLVFLHCSQNPVSRLNQYFNLQLHNVPSILSGSLHVTVV